MIRTDWRTTRCILYKVSVVYCYVADQVYRFPITFRLAENYPVDLYFLMDVSRTMRSYKENLVALSDRLGRFLRYFLLYPATILLVLPRSSRLSYSNIKLVLNFDRPLWERPLYFASSFFQTLFLCRFCTNFLETLPHGVGLSAIENVSSTFSYVPIKEIRGQKPHFGDFVRIPHQHIAMSLRSAKKFYNSKTTAYNADVHSLCVPNLLGDGTYNKGEPLSVKFSFNKNLGIWTQDWQLLGPYRRNVPASCQTGSRLVSWCHSNWPPTDCWHGNERLAIWT